MIDKPHYTKQIYQNWIDQGLYRDQAQKARWLECIAYYDQNRLEFEQAASQKPPGEQESACSPNGAEAVFYLGVVLAATKRNHGRAMQLYVIAKSIDQGRGVIERGELIKTLSSLGIHERRIRRMVSDAVRAGFISPVRGGLFYRLSGWDKAGGIVGAFDRGYRVSIPLEKWVDNWRSWAWAAAITALGQDCETVNDKGEKINYVAYNPVSREKLAQLTGIPERTQRHLEKSIPVVYRKNYVLTGIPGASLAGFREENRAAISRSIKDRGSFIAIRKPDSRYLRKIERDQVLILSTMRRYSPVSAKTGRAGIDSSFAGCPLPDDRLGASRGQEAIKGRIFYRKVSAWERKLRKITSGEVFMKLPRENHHKAGWWQMGAINA